MESGTALRVGLGARPGSVPTLTYPEAQRIVREAVKDKTYELYPLGQEVAVYLRVKRKRLTASSYDEYESCLSRFARHFVDLSLEDFEPPVGAERLEEFLDGEWGARAQRTYNKNLSILGDFFNHFYKHGRLHGNPTTLIERAKARGVHRETFNADARRSIIAGQPELRDRLGVRLLLDYGLRKGSLQAVQFKHFDHVRKRLTIFSKGGKVRNLPIPDPAFWHDLERLILDSQAEPHHYLMQRVGGNQYASSKTPDKPMGAKGLHHWWYRCLYRAGVVPKDTTKGERMHKARHTAAQHLLEATGNVKAVQALLGHESIQTTEQYVDWSDDQLAQSLARMLESDEE